MAAPSHFPHIMVPDTSTKSRAQKYERKNTSAILRAQNSKFYILAISWKLYAGKFLETICWKIWVDAGCFLKGVIMAQCYGIILRFQGSGTRGSVEHPSSADLSRMMCSEVSEVIGSVEQGMGIRNPSGSSVRTSCWASTAASKWIRRL